MKFFTTRTPRLKRDNLINSTNYLHACSGRRVSGCALWFAARGASGTVLLSGMGADEQLGGYSSHRAAFLGGGWQQLYSQLASDLHTIALRNMGQYSQYSVLPPCPLSRLKPIYFKLTHQLQTAAAVICHDFSASTNSMETSRILLFSVQLILVVAILKDSDILFGSDCNLIFC